MKIIQCENGHYYNSEKFESCPHCQAIKNETETPIAFNKESFFTEKAVPTSENTDTTVDSSSQKTVAINEPIGVLDSADDAIPQNEFVPYQQPQAAEPIVELPPTQLVQEPAYTPQQVYIPPQQPVKPPFQQFPQQPLQQPVQTPQIQGTTLESLMRNAREQKNTQKDNDVTVRLADDERLSNPTVGWLIGINKDYYGVCFELKSGKNFVGRSYDMDIVLDSDMSVSRYRHAIIIYEPKAKVFIAQPGESRELFYLNDDVVLQNEILKPYDILLIGKIKLMFFPLCGDKFSWEELNK